MHLARTYVNKIDIFFGIIFLLLRINIFKYCNFDTARLTHESYIVNMNGNSYRLKKTQKWLKNQ